MIWFTPALIAYDCMGGSRVHNAINEEFDYKIICMYCTNKKTDDVEVAEYSLLEHFCSLEIIF